MHSSPVTTPQATPKARQKPWLNSSNITVFPSYGPVLSEASNPFYARSRTHTH